MDQQNWYDIFLYSEDYTEQFKKKVDEIQAEKGQDFNHTDISHFDLIHISKHQGVDKFVETYPIEDGMKILDIGAGLGGTSRHIAGSRDVKLHGIDYLPHLVQAAIYANQKCNLDQKITFESGDITEMNLGENLYDRALAIGLFIYVDDDFAFRNIASSLKSGGLFYYQDYYFVIPKEEFEESETKLYWERKMVGVRTKQHLIRAITDAGLTVIEEDNWGKVWSQAAWDRAERYLKGMKEGTMEVSPENYRQRVVIPPNLMNELDVYTPEEIQQRYPLMAEEMDIQDIIYTKRKFVSAVRIIARKD